RRGDEHLQAKSKVGRGEAAPGPAAAAGASAATAATATGAAAAPGAAPDSAAEWPPAAADRARELAAAAADLGLARHDLREDRDVREFLRSRRRRLLDGPLEDGRCLVREVPLPDEIRRLPRRAAGRAPQQARDRPHALPVHGARAGRV